MTQKRLLGIEISDLGITAAFHGETGPRLIPLDGELLALSSFAQLTGKGEVIFGRTAFHQFHVADVPLDNKFWFRLGTVEAENQETSKSRFQPADVDLAQAHLAAVLETCRLRHPRFDEVAIAVPGHFKSSKLGSLLEIASGMDLPVHHVIDASLASLLAASSVPEGEPLLVADLHWNNAEVTHVGISESHIERRGVLDDQAIGFGKILDRLIDGIGKRFIEECRFDPVARKDYAQELFNQLFDFLTGSTPESTCKLQTAKGSITVDHATLAGMIDQELQSLIGLIKRGVAAAGGPAGSVFLSRRLQFVPGLTDRIDRTISSPVLLMDMGQAAMGALTFLMAAEVGPSGQPLFHTRVEFAESAIREDQPKAASMVAGEVYQSGPKGILRATPATHLLFQGRLLPLPRDAGEPDFAIGNGETITNGLALVEKIEGLAPCHVLIRRQAGAGLEMTNNGCNQTWLNGIKISPGDTVSLQTGDVITLGDPVLQLMVVGMANTDA